MAETTRYAAARRTPFTPSPVRHLILMAFSIFLVEMAVMGIIHLLPFAEEPEGFYEALLDSLFLVLLLSPMLYYFLFRPLLLHIHERRRAEESVKAERTRLETVTENIGAGLAIISRDYRTLWANGIIRTIFGDVVGKSCYSAYNRQSDVCLNCAVREVFEKGANKVIREQKGEDVAGRAVWSQIIATPVLDTEGNITAALELVVPITERKQAEETIQEERNKLKGILDVMPDGVYTVNGEYEIQYINPALTRHFGPVSGRRCYAYFHDRSSRCPWCKNDEVFAGKQVRWEMRMEKTGRVYDLFDTPIRSDDGSIAKLEIVHDVTERKRAEDALKESEKQLRRLSSQLLTAQEEERRRISQGLHDELGQALTLLKLQMRAIENGLRADQPALRDECEHSLRYIDQVIDDVRRLSRELSPAMLDQGLSAALRWHVGNFARSHCLKVDFEPGGVDLDRHFAREEQTLIYRIIQESLTNIGKHAYAKNVSVIIGRHDGRIAFLVADDGVGFDPGSESQKGAIDRGLGLSAMEERVRMLGGRLDLWSEKGNGTRITFTVPEERRAAHESLSHRPG